MSRLDEIEARVRAATPQPWYWRNTGEPMLLGGTRMQLVMGFARMGMNGAQPEFRGPDGLMVKAGRENINAFADADLIANAPTDLRDLVAVARAALAIAASLSGRTSTDMMQTWTTCFRESDLRALVNALAKLESEEAER